LYAEEMEDVLDEAGKVNEQLHEQWMDFIGDEEYQQLMEFFAKENFYDTWEDEPLLPEQRTKKLKAALVGKDRLALIQAAFSLGWLVGRAQQILLDKE